MKIDHVGIAVKNLDEAVKFYRDVLGLELVKIEEVPEEKVRIAMFRVGESYIELLQGTDPESAISK
ncbi:MAG: VOC family protein, partial [Sulfolobales archaeon]